MFRGGPVSSYGTGIASGLGKPKRGFVDEPGSYAGEQFLISPSMYDELVDTGGSRSFTRYKKPIGPPRGGLSGGNIYTQALAKARNIPVVGRFAVPLFGSAASAIGTGAGVGMGIGALTDFYAKSTYTPEGYKRLKEMSGPNYAFDETETGEDMEAAQAYIDEGNQIGEAPGFFPQGGKDKFYKDKGLDPETGLPVDDIDTVAGDGLPGETKKGEVGNVIDSLMKSTKERAKELTQTEEPEVNAKQMVEDNKKLFAEMLGTQKMRRRYGEDVLAELSKGFLEGEGFRGALKRAVDVKSAEPKVDQQAAILAINDYIAGKRSKESMDRILGQIDYKIKKTMEAGQLTGNWLSDLKKVSDRYRGNEGISDIKVIKDTLFETTGVNPQVSSFPKKNFNDIDTKELAVGINIVIAKDGRKIIAKNESGEIQDLSRQYPI
jgi:hypothetical protein